jgi:hypothetical protein
MFKRFQFSEIIGVIIVVKETAIDQKGRIVISKHSREKPNIRPLSRKRKTTGMKPTTPNEFIQEMERFIKEGSAVRKTNPLKLNKIWEKQ